MSDARAATDGLREALSAVIGGGYLDGSLTADDILRAIEAAGWQVVPKEPTEEMLRDGAAKVRTFLEHEGNYPRTHAMWVAMLAAAPRP